MPVPKLLDLLGCTPEYVDARIKLIGEGSLGRLITTAWWSSAVGEAISDHAPQVRRFTVVI